MRKTYLFLSVLAGCAMGLPGCLNALGGIFPVLAAEVMGVALSAIAMGIMGSLFPVAG